MSELSAEDLLRQALPGSEVPASAVPRNWRGICEAPWRFWRSNADTWAAFVVAGRRLAKTTLEGIGAARAQGLKCLVILSDPEAMSAVAPAYVTGGFHVVCRIAGEGRLVPPVSPPIRGARAATSARARVPVDLLDEVTSYASCPASLRRRIRDLRRGYTLRRWSDDREYQLLKDFAGRVLRSMGFRRACIPEMLRKLESVGYGGRRDHFFHSFQNYFLGLLAVMQLPDRFSICQQVARLNFEVDPLHVWFLTALWHDAGYGIAGFDVLVDDVLSVDGEETAEFARARFLGADIVQEARTVIASLMVRLMRPSSGRTQWLEPRRGARRSHQQKRLEEAIEHNVLYRSHGAASALKLYAQYVPLIRRMAPQNELVLRQMVYLACSSMPFHDWSFREAVRRHCGDCRISTDSMPFAGLLAFVDSIQDDRRDLQGVREELSFLEHIDVLAPATVQATVNLSALGEDALLGKVVEARDVLASLIQHADGLYFSYPSWMVA